MFSSVVKINDIDLAIKRLKDAYDVGGGKHSKGTAFELTDIKRAPGSGVSSDLIAHQQGVFQCDGDQNYVIVGSVKNNPSYFYLIKNGRGCQCNGDKDYWPIETAMTHPGGIQVAEDILAIGNEQYAGATTRGDRSNIRFFNIAEESAVYELSHLLIEREGSGKIASAVALTKNDEQWLLTVRDKLGLDFYCLNGDPSDSNSRFEFLGSLDRKTYGLKDFQGIQMFPTVDRNFYLFGHPDGSSTTDKCFIFKINFIFDDNGLITHVSNANEDTTIHFERSGSGPRFKWGAGVRYDEGRNAFEVTSIAGHVVDGKIACNRWG